MEKKSSSDNKDSAANSGSAASGPGLKRPPAAPGKPPAQHGSKNPELAASKPKSRASKTATSDNSQVDVNAINARIDRMEGLVSKLVDTVSELNQSGSPGSGQTVEHIMETEPVDDQDQDLGFRGSEDDGGEIYVPTLAAKFAVPANVGHTINSEIANSTAYMIANPLEDKTIGDTQNKYPPPKNIPFLDPPKVNATIWENLQPPTRSRDLKIQRVQKSLTRGISAMVNALSESEVQPSETQQDALALLCNANYELNLLRREFLKPDMGPKFAHVCKPSTPITSHLFGDDLAKRVKELTDEQRVTSGVMKQSSAKNRYTPYDKPGPRPQPRAGPSGYSRPSFSQTSSKPFLGKQPQWTQRRQSVPQRQAQARPAQFQQNFQKAPPPRRR